MIKIFGIGIVAGLASALMVASLASGAPLSLLLFNFAPLPILVVALGWSHVAGLVAAGIAATLLAAIFGHLLFLTYLAAIALPAWWIGYLAMLARPAGSGISEEFEWYPLGRLTLWMALAAALIVMLMVFIIAHDSASLRAALRPIVVLYRDNTAAGTALPSWLMQALVDHPDRVLVPASAAITMLMQVFTLWLAARIVSISGRLRRPWPALADMRLPPLASAAVGVSLLLALLPDTIGLAALALLAALLTAHALLGLAIIHRITRALRGRGIILGALYGSIAILGWPLLAMPLIGLADAVVDFRHRWSRNPPALPH